MTYVTVNALAGTTVEIAEILPSESEVYSRSDGTKTGKQWVLPVVHRLVDGHEIVGSETFRRKRDAVERLAELPARPTWKTSLEFDESGFPWIRKVEVFVPATPLEEVS